MRTAISTRDTSNESIIPEQEKHRDDMRAVVLVPVLKQRDTRDTAATPAAAGRSVEAKLEEAKGLALAIDLEVTQGLIVAVNQPRPATLFGTGKIEEIGHLLDETNSGLVIVDHPLTPVQQRNLEKHWNAKVIDRTGLILGDLRAPSLYQGGYAAGRSCASELSEGSPRSKLDPP